MSTSRFVVLALAAVAIAALVDTATKADARDWRAFVQKHRCKVVRTESAPAPIGPKVDVWRCANGKVYRR